jgi:hypothetical protein
MGSKKKNMNVAGTSKDATNAGLLNTATELDSNVLHEAAGTEHGVLPSSPALTNTTNTVVEPYDSATGTQDTPSFTAESAFSQVGHNLSSVEGEQNVSTRPNDIPSVANAPANPAVVGDVFASDTTTGDIALQLQVGLNVPGSLDSQSLQADATPVSVLTTLTIDRAHDSAGGETGVVGNGDTLDDIRPLISGQSSEIGTFITLYDNGDLLGSAYVDLSGRWQFQVPSAQAFEPGEHVLTVVDEAGNTSAPFTLFIDIPESSRPIIDTVFDDVGQIGEIANGGITDDRSPTLRGYGEPGTQVFLYDGSTRVGSAFVQADGSYTLRVQNLLAPGEHTFTAVINDIASHPFTLTVADTEPTIKPVIDLAFDDFGQTGDIANGGTTDDTTPTLRGQGEAFAEVQIYNGSTRIGYAYSGADGTWLFNVPKLSLGEHVLKAVSTTNAGTVLTSDPFTLNISAPNSPKPVISSAFDDFGQSGDVANGGTTDDTTPILSGQAEAYTQLQVYRDGIRIGFAPTSADGHWSFYVPTLSPGEHVFTVVGAGVTSDPFTLTIGTPDSPKPVINSALDDFGRWGDVVNGGTTDDTTPMLSGQAEAYSQVQVYRDGIRIGFAPTSADGSWWFQVPALSLGEHVFTVISAGVTSDPFTLTIGTPDSAKPEINSAYDNFGQSGDVANGGTTDDTTPILRGQGEALSQVQIYRDGIRIGFAPTSSDGSWSFNVPTLSLGEHVFTAVGAGVTSDPFTLTIGTPDLARPEINSAYDNFGQSGDVANGGTTDDTTPLLSGHAEPFTQIQVYRDGIRIGYAPTSSDGNWSFPVPTLGLGTHVFTVVSAGVTSDPFTLNISAPTKPVISSAIDDFGRTGDVVNGGTTDDTTPRLTGQGVAFSQVHIFNGDVRIGSAFISPDGTWSFPVPRLALGEHVFTVVNSGVTSDPFTLNISAPDSARPVIDSVTDNIGAVGELVSGATTDDARPTFQGQGEPSTRIDIYDNGKQIGATTVAQDGSWSFTNHNTKLSPGEHVFTFAGAGVTSEPFVLYIENVPAAPQPTIDSAFDNAGTQTGSVNSGAVIDDPRPVFSGRGDPDAIISMYDNFNYIGNALVDGNGNWTFQPRDFTPLNIGEHVFTALIDGVHSAPFILHVEAAAPSIQMAMNEATPDLPSLFELLQPASELFAGEADLSPLSDVVLDLSGTDFNEALYAGSPQLETTDGVPVVFSTVTSTEFWQQPTEHSVG